MKDLLREKYLQKRDGLPLQTIKKKSVKIIDKLLLLPEIKKAQTIFLYISFRGEVYTHDFIKSLIKSKIVIVPIISDIKKKTLVLSQLNNWKHVSVGAYGIPEPRPEFINEVTSKDFDIALVPGILFDIRGHRIGYGGGYYDKLLKELTTLKIGLAYDTQIIRHIPSSEHDVAMDKIVTDKRVIVCRKNYQP